MAAKSKGTVYLFFVILFNSIYSTYFESMYLFIVTTLISILLFVITNHLFERADQYYQIITISWIIGLLFALILYLIYMIEYKHPYWMEGLDDYYFDVVWSDAVVDKGYYTIPQMMKDRLFWLGNANGYILVLSYIKRLGVLEYSTMIPRVINIGLLNMNSLFICSYIKNKLKLTDSQLKIMLLIMTVFPNALFIVSHVYRDQFCATFFVLLFYMWSDYSSKSKVKKVSIIVFSIIIMYWAYWFRATNIILALGIIMVSIYNKNSWESIIKKKISFRNLLILFAIVGFAGILVVKYFTKFQQWEIRYNYYSRGMLDIGGFQEIIYGIPLLPLGWLFRILYYLVSPFESGCLNLFACTNGSDYLNAFRTMGTIFLLFLYPYVIKAIWTKKNNLGAVFLGIMVPSALTTAGFRHMITFYPFLLALGLSEFWVTDKIKRKNYFICSFMAFFMMICLSMI